MKKKDSGGFPFKRVSQKLAGRFQLISKTESQAVVHCFGELGRLGVNQDDVDFICRFYMIPPTEAWLRENAKDAGDSFYIIIRR